MMIDEKSLGEVMSLADIEVAEPRKQSEIGQKQRNSKILGSSNKKRGGIKQSASKLFARIAQKQEEQKQQEDPTLMKSYSTGNSSSKPLPTSESKKNGYITRSYYQITQPERI